MKSEFLEECFSLDEDEGILTWKTRPLTHFKSLRGMRIWNTKFAGKPAGGINAQGYLAVKVNFVPILNHRIIWILLHGEIPGGFVIDHVDHDRLNNKPPNLRLVRQEDNTRNASLRKDSSSGVSGVSFHKASGKWVSYLHHCGKRVSYTTHESFEDAVQTQMRLRVQYGFHENHGKP